MKKLLAVFCLLTVLLTGCGSEAAAPTTEPAVETTAEPQPSSSSPPISNWVQPRLWNKVAYSSIRLFVNATATSLEISIPRE